MKAIGRVSSKCKEVVETYPVLKRIKEDSVVILFTSKCEGTVVVGNNRRRLGDHRNDWVPSCFEVFNGEVTIQNEVEVEDIWYEF